MPQKQSNGQYLYSNDKQTNSILNQINSISLDPNKVVIKKDEKNGQMLVGSTLGGVFNNPFVFKNDKVVYEQQ